MKIINYLFWLLFPNRCPCCNKLIAREEKICVDCNKKIERIKSLCVICGCEKNECECDKRVFRFRKAAAPFKYGEYSKLAVYNFKFNGNIEIAEFLSDNMYNSICKYFTDIKFDCVECVPMHFFKKITNGYNQSEILAKKLARKLNVPYTKNLVKIKNNNAQHKTKREKRVLNVKDVFYCKTFSAKNVLLVDDIKTTGATLNECAKQLMLAGAENVYCITAISNSLHSDK